MDYAKRLIDSIPFEVKQKFVGEIVQEKTNEIMSFINPVSEMDLPIVIYALETIAHIMRTHSETVAEMADILHEEFSAVAIKVPKDTPEEEIERLFKKKMQEVQDATMENNL